MDRRNAVFSIFLAGGGVAASLSGYKWIQLNRTPDLSFLDHHKSMIADLAEVIIPRTGSPGAKDAGVGEFIIRMIKEVCDRKAQNNFIDGLKEMESYTSGTYNKGFSDLSAPQQRQVVTRFREKGASFRGIVGKVERKMLGKSFFAILKEATVIGYCTSKIGATQGLAYDYIPGAYVCCISANEQKSWATK